MKPPFHVCCLYYNKWRKINKENSGKLEKLNKNFEAMAPESPGWFSDHPGTVLEKRFSLRIVFPRTVPENLRIVDRG
jgi:hypothetical protein